MFSVHFVLVQVGLAVGRGWAEQGQAGRGRQERVHVGRGQAGRGQAGRGQGLLRPSPPHRSPASPQASSGPRRDSGRSRRRGIKVLFEIFVYPQI